MTVGCWCVCVFKVLRFVESQIAATLFGEAVLGKLKGGF